MTICFGLPPSIDMYISFLYMSINIEIGLFHTSSTCEKEAAICCLNFLNWYVKVCVAYYLRQQYMICDR